MICINFFDHDKLAEAFVKLYGFDKDEIIRLAFEAADRHDPTLYFVEQTKIKIDIVDVKKVYLHCKHITTSIDDLESLKSNGMMTLNESLSKKTPLSDFLQEHQIRIQVPQRKVYYKGNQFTLYDSNEECQECFYNTECQYKSSMFSNNESLVYRDMACPFRDAIKVLRSKLYDDIGKIEVHLAGSKEDINGYSEVRKHPEILNTLETLLNELFTEKICLCRDWDEQTHGKYYCLDFDVNIYDFERITTTLDEYDYYPFLKYCQKSNSSLDNVSPNFLANIFFLYNGLPVLAFEGKSLCGQLLSDTKIPYKRITVTEFEN